MIFVCLGSQQYQFNRLLQKLDELVDENAINNVFAQIGSSTYKPQHYECRDFLSQEEYEKKVKDANLIITHAGTGAIIKALKAQKQVIVVPRQAKYGEHADDHQFQIADFMEENGYVFKVIEMDNLLDTITESKSTPRTKKFVGNGHIIEIIESYIESGKPLNMN